MTDLTVFRIYEPRECGPDGYPRAWHETIKHQVRAEAGHRCIRCLHPYVVGQPATWEASEFFIGDDETWRQFEELEQTEPELKRAMKRATHWSPCDEQCRHVAPDTGTVRMLTPAGIQFVGDDGASYAAGFVRSSFDGEVLVEAAWRILTVHHLNERKFDCRWHNLVALCQRCHLTVQRKVEMNQVFPFEHSDWFKPYAAAFYAYSYLGEELTREETNERQDELLGLERVA